nr:bifunctional glutamate N-acetyltransferase/amino-acid acetyltransferase ArgJ [Chrysiogenes arsenatis]
MNQCNIVSAGTLLPKGFFSATTCASVKPNNTTRDDMALIFSKVPATGAAVYTTNKVFAAPITVCRESLSDGRAQAIVVNSGNANAATGSQGLQDARMMRRIASEALQINELDVLVASTGVIGLPLPMDRMVPAIHTMGASKIAPYDPLVVAQAIRTTDLFEKHGATSLQVGNKEVIINAVCKGAGMICPNMATMLCFVQSDAALTKAAAQSALQTAVHRSFNRILVDGDMSTNDTVTLMANGLSGAPTIDIGTPEYTIFTEALTALLVKLGKDIVRDGEGSTKVVNIIVQGAVNDDDAQIAAKSIANSNLCKTAFFGCDPNWGRIAAAVGYSGAQIDQNSFDLFFDQVQIVRQGVALSGDTEQRAAEVLQKEEFTIRFDLNLGDGIGNYWCSDLGYEYVKVNADYRT